MAEEKYDFEESYPIYGLAVYNVLDILALDGDLREAVGEILDIIGKHDVDIKATFEGNPAVYIETKKRDPTGNRVVYIELFEGDDCLGECMITILLERIREANMETNIVKTKIKIIPAAE